MTWRLMGTLALLQLVGPGFAVAADSPDLADVIAAGGVYSAADGSEVMRIRHHDATDLSAIAHGVTKQELPAGAELLTTEELGEGPATAVVTAFKLDGDTRILSVSVALRNGGGALSLAHFIDPTIPQAASRLSQASSSLLESAMRGDSVASDSDTDFDAAHADENSDNIEPSNRQSSDDVERIVFELHYTYGVGGGAIPDYTPIVLFRDGIACRCLGNAIDEIDIQHVRQTRANRVGTWQASGSNYEVRWPGAKKAKILKPDVGPPSELPNSAALLGRFQSISGGGNTALGGDVLIAAVEDYTFHRDGSFSQSNTSLSTSDAVIASGKYGRAGTWTLAGSTLALSYVGGKVVRTTVFYSGSRKSTASFGRFGVLWIGGEGFKRVE